MAASGSASPSSVGSPSRTAAPSNARASWDAAARSPLLCQSDFGGVGAKDFQKSTRCQRTVFGGWNPPSFQDAEGRRTFYDNAVFLELSGGPIRGTVCHWIQMTDLSGGASFVDRKSTRLN